MLKSDEIKTKILQAINDEKWHSYYDIQRKCNINYAMLKKHIYFLKLIGFVKVIEINSEESATGKGSYKVKITEDGKKILRILQQEI